MSPRKKTTSEVAEPIKSVLSDEPAEAVEIQADPMPDPEPESVVYLGPSIGKYINHGTVYEGGVLPQYLKDKIEEIPAIASLIVPVSRYAEVALAITLPEGRLKRLYEYIESKAN